MKFYCYFCKTKNSLNDPCEFCSKSNIKVYTYYDTRYEAYLIDYHQAEQESIRIYFYTSPSYYKYNIYYSIEQNMTHIYSHHDHGELHRLVIKIPGCPIKPHNAWEKLSTILTFL